MPEAQLGDSRGRGALTKGGGLVVAADGRRLEVIKTGSSKKSYFKVRVRVDV